ncbi:FCD domain-containing protein [Actinomadura verrucosospora]|uniref:FCD domain-containing protein n=1 Tax=Actinomadura verrucosospora TaxID=46165 RepID=UPI001C209AFC
MLSEQVHTRLRDAIMHGGARPRHRPQTAGLGRTARREPDRRAAHVRRARGRRLGGPRASRQHRLARTPTHLPEEGEYCSDAWAEAHRVFHRTLLEGGDNPVLLETFDRLWTGSEPARRLSALRAPDRDAVAEHRRLDETAPARAADSAAKVLMRHLTLNAAGLTGCSEKEA